MKRNLISFLTAAMLCSCAGCSDSSEVPGVEPTPTPEVGGDYSTTDMVIYEANPRVFATERAFSAIEAHLDHIQSVGTTVLWLMPINEPGVKNSVNSPYCIKDYYGLNSRYGTLDELKSLVKAAHAKGLKVIMDWVANHTSWDNAWITEHPDWYTQDANGNIVSPQEQNWADVADLNFGNTEMQRAMIDALKYWVQEVGIDGYRFDYAEGVPDSFWKTALSELRALNSEMILLAEGGKTSLMANGFDLLYGWNFHTKLKEYYGGKGSLDDLYTVHKSELEGMPEGTLRLRYTTNHDQASEASPIQCYGGERGAMSAFVLATLLEGVPLIYSSQEAAYAQKLNFFNYAAIDLKANEAFRAETAKVIAAYKSTKDVRGGELKLYSTGKVASFYRAAGDHGLFVMVNTTGESVQVKVPMERAGEKMQNLISGESLTLPTALTLEAYEYLICKK